mmetsp:Transcript_67970/g.112993  ORF Transcript_67970/g.112993 Transcript_67970/m.112993 type:complete len:102 (-) Transcript_67970:533-838(-)
MAIAMHYGTASIFSMEDPSPIVFDTATESAAIAAYSVANGGAAVAAMPDDLKDRFTEYPEHIQKFDRTIFRKIMGTITDQRACDRYRVKAKRSAREFMRVC